MSYFSDEQLWNLQRRAGAVLMFIDSSIHLLRPSPLLREVYEKRFEGSVEAGLGGIAMTLFFTARREALGEVSHGFTDFSPEGFTVQIEMANDEYPAELLAAFAEDVNFAERKLTFRVLRARIEAMVADWLARGRPVPGVIPAEVRPQTDQRD